jgi:chromosome segregation ATPase
LGGININPLHPSYPVARESEVMMRIMHDIRALDYNVHMLAQKIQKIQSNERVIVRNIVALSKKIAQLQEAKSSSSSVSDEAIQEIQDKLMHIEERLMKLEEDVDYLKHQLQHTLTSDDVAELKYIVETINPLEFVTYKQIGELVEKKLKELGII